MSTIFTKIIEREIPGYFIYEDDVCVAIMDVFPSVEGQSLVILKREVNYLFDVTEDEYFHLMNVARHVAKATDKALDVERTCMVVEGFEVPHVHVKLFPVKEVTDGVSLNSLTSNFEEASPEALAALAEKIKEAL